jgi:hypothetical protein
MQWQVRVWETAYLFLEDKRESRNPKSILQVSLPAEYSLIASEQSDI